MAIHNDFDQLNLDAAKRIVLQKPSAEEYPQIYSSWLDSSIALTKARDEATINQLAEIESLAVDGKIPESRRAHDEMVRRLVRESSPEVQKSIWDECQPKPLLPRGSRPNHRYTGERKVELDQGVERGVSGISGLIFCAGHARKDIGDYAGLNLMTTQGHLPIAVHDGLKELLLALGLLEKYVDRIPTTPGKLLFDKEDRFRVEWERLPNGTRVFVRMVRRS